MKFLHTMIRVKDIKKSLKFYEELIGLKVSRTMDLDDCRLHFLTDGVSNVEIELTENFETPDGGYSLGEQFGHFAFETKSLDEFSAKLKDFGLEYLYEPFEIKPSLRIAFIQDPDGREVEIIER